jgi:hypothetical protein
MSVRIGKILIQRDEDTTLPKVWLPRSVVGLGSLARLPAFVHQTALGHRVPKRYASAVPLAAL